MFDKNALILVEFGSSFNKKTNHKKLLGLIEDKNAFFHETANKLKNKLENVGIAMPTIYYNSSYEYLGKDVKIYIGLKIYILNNPSLSDVFNFIYNKIIEVSNESKFYDEGYSSILKEIDEQQYQLALHKSNILYYYGYVNDNTDLMLNCILEVASLRFHNNQFDIAQEYYAQASLIADDINYLNYPLKMKIFYNYAIVLNKLFNYDESTVYLGKLYKLAENNSNVEIEIMALLLLAQNNYIMSNNDLTYLEHCISNLKYAVDLCKNNQNKDFIIKLQQDIISLYEEFLNEKYNSIMMKEYKGTISSKQNNIEMIRDNLNNFSSLLGKFIVYTGKQLLSAFIQKQIGLGIINVTSIHGNNNSIINKYNLGGIGK